MVIKGFSEFMLNEGKFELVDVEPLGNLLSLRSPLGLDV